MLTVEEILKENERRKKAFEAPYENNETAGEKRYGQVPEINNDTAGRSVGEDFGAWAERCVKIKPKGGGSPVPFVLNRPQRRLVAELEKMRRNNLPIRLILLKARQWGGSTCIQLYMAWLQIMHATGLNSLIIAHQISGSEEIKDMFDRMVENYIPSPGPSPGPTPDPSPQGRGEGASRLTLKRVGRSGATYRLIERDCKITIGTAERPDSSRGGDYNLVHLSEVGLWKKTKGKSPEDIVRSSTSGVLLRPMTMIVMESTANGAGTYFHREYLAAKAGESQFRALFIPWYEIEAYRLPIENPEEFAETLLRERKNTVSSGRSESGEYHWSLWKNGATLEAINWYRTERRKFADHGGMASEYPSNDIEAFVHSGERVFAPEAIERLREGVKSPEKIGEIDENITGNPVFNEDSTGAMEIWQLPPEIPDKNRHIVVVDVGGRSAKSDWSVITVINRLGATGLPEVVAQWRGHTDFDILAKKAALIGKFYHNALLIIESNTLETHDRERETDGLQAPYLLSQLEDDYGNLYMRLGANGRARPGFHTNTSTKPMVIGNLVKMVREGLYVERDIKAIEELIQYERKPSGSYGAYTGCHDDILMTRAIGLHVLSHELDPLTPARAGAGGVRRHPQDAFGRF